MIFLRVYTYIERSNAMSTELDSDQISRWLADIPTTGLYDVKRASGWTSVCAEPDDDELHCMSEHLVEFLDLFGEVHFDECADAWLHSATFTRGPARLCDTQAVNTLVMQFTNNIDWWRIRYFYYADGSVHHIQRFRYFKGYWKHHCGCGPDYVEFSIDHEPMRVSYRTAGVYHRLGEKPAVVRRIPGQAVALNVSVDSSFVYHMHECAYWYHLGVQKKRSTNAGKAWCRACDSVK